MTRLLLVIVLAALLVVAAGLLHLISVAYFAGVLSGLLLGLVLLLRIKRRTAIPRR